MKQNGILAIMRKELARFFSDKRMVVSILLPGVLIYVMYSFMGQAMGSLYGVEEDYVPTVQVVQLPDSVVGLVETGVSPLLTWSSIIMPLPLPPRARTCC